MNKWVTVKWAISQLCCLFAIVLIRKQNRAEEYWLKLKIYSQCCNLGYPFVCIILSPMEQHALKSVKNCLNTNIYSYLQKVLIFSTPVLIRHLRLLHWCLIHAVLLFLPRRRDKRATFQWQILKLCHLIHNIVLQKQVETWEVWQKVQNL
jgi:hypothetical protein